MSDSDSLHKVDGSVVDLQKSNFPTFAVNVPMPRDTAVPGSFNNGANQPPQERAAAPTGGNK